MATRTLVVGPDGFTAADNTQIDTYSANWLNQDDGGGNGWLKIFSNSYRSNGGMIDGCWQGAGTFGPSQYFETTIVGTFTNSDQDFLGGNLRNNGGSRTTRNLYRVTYEPFAGVIVDKVVLGNSSKIGATISASFAAGDKLSAEAVTYLDTVDINVYKDTGSGPVLLGTRTDSGSILASGKPGISGAVSVGNLRGDDWTAGTLDALAARQTTEFVGFLMTRTREIG